MVMGQQYLQEMVTARDFANRINIGMVGINVHSCSFSLSHFGVGKNLLW